MSWLRKLLASWCIASSQNGFALIAVLWICGLLAVVTTALVLQVRTSLLSAQRDKSMSQLGSIADSVVKALAYDLASLPATQLTPLANGGAHACRWSKETVVVTRVQDQAGLVDINTAAPLLMTSLLKGLGTSPSLSGQIAGELLDFRDQDQSPAEGNPATETYATADFQPKNAPFELVEELDQIPSISDELLQKLTPFVTVHSQQTGFDRATAPADLLGVLAAAGLADQALQVLLSPSPLKSFAIEVRVIGPANRQFGRGAIVNLLRQPDRPYALLSWSRLRTSMTQTFDEATLNPCFN